MSASTGQTPQPMLLWAASGPPEPSNAAVVLLDRGAASSRDRRVQRVA